MKNLNKIFAISTVCFGLAAVSAYAYNDSSGLQLSPVFNLDEKADSLVYDLESVYNTAQVAHAGVIFTNGTLPAGMVQQPHDFPIYLYDQDPIGNADDDLKRYEGMFEGGTLTEVKYMTTNYPNEEAIDSSGDNIAELYISGTLMRKLSLGGTDNSQVDGEPMFYFNIQLK